jgi:6-phosphogluconolactonase
VAFSGGSLPAIVAPGLIQRRDRIEFCKWRVYLSDERAVPLDHKDSNFKECSTQLFEALAAQTSFQISQVAAVDTSLELSASAEEYESRLRTECKTGKIPSFDLILLGIGEDGHMCSLFPAHELLTETKKLIAPITDSPKAPPRRVTFTLPLLDAARHLLFVAAGASKRDILPAVQLVLNLCFNFLYFTFLFVGVGATLKVASRPCPCGTRHLYG